MVRKLNAAQLADYAQQQIQAAQAIERQHRIDRLGLCSCGRPQPCAVVTACLATIAHYGPKLALIGATMPLPVIAPREQAGRPQPDPNTCPAEPQRLQSQGRHAAVA